ncbi:MAG: cardiolipin synthase [Oscillospiraceae bacterium]|nr:cardiolipin synthase [Oscillospiraceae bacterium]
MDGSRLVRSGKRGILRIIFGRSMLILLLMVMQFLLVFARLYDVFRDLPLLFGGVEVFTALMLLHVLNSGENPAIKLSWCVIIALLPVFGMLLYFFVRLEIGHRMVRKMVDSSMADSRKYLPPRAELKEKLKLTDRNLHNLVHYMECHGNFPIYAGSDVQYFPLGEDMFQEMLIQLEKAEKFIFMEYFSLAPGYMWGKILEILSRKVQQGVEVRVLYDGTAALAQLPYGYPKQLQNLGIQCKMFSPVRPFVSTHYNNRDHRKITVIDGTVAFTGGINLEDRYINKETVYGHWKDTAVMVRGEAAQGFTLMFLQMWNHNEKERVFGPYLTLPQSVNTGSGYVMPYGDSPMDNENVGEMVYLNILNQAKDYVYIMTPYLILDNEMLTGLTFAAKRGVDVRLILPHIPDKKYAFVLAKSHYRALFDAGVKIYEYTPGFVHAKVFLSDDIHAVVGTINLDYRSLYHHFECGAYLYKVPALKDIMTDFRDTMEKSQLITDQDIRRQSLMTRITGRILKLAAPLM